MSPSKEIEEKFAQVIESNKGILYKVAGAYTKNDHDRQDLIQEILIQLWKAFPKYDNSFKLSTWIYRIALNVSISYLRKEGGRKKRHSKYVSQIDWPEIDDESQDKRLNQLYTSINQLKEFDKAIIILKLEGLSNEEISKVVGISISNVSTRLNRIKEQLINKNK